MPYGESPNKMGHSPAEMGHSPLEGHCGPLKMESNKQEKYNLMHDNPVAKHASWMSKHASNSRMSPLEKGHSPLEKHLAGHTEPTTMQKIRNFVEPGLSKNQSGNSRQQMFDYDGDGDTMFNDSNRDGTMLGRGIEKAKKIGKKALKRSAENFADVHVGAVKAFADGLMGFPVSTAKGIKNLFSK